MSKILNISEATALALHAMIYLEYQKDRLVSTKEIAEAFSASEAHLAKVMQRLVKARFVKSVRGPKGGFALEKQCEDIKILHIYEAFEGSLSEHSCLFDKPVCGLEKCVIGDLLGKLNDKVLNYLNTTSLCDVAEYYKKK
ncbi:MAG: Rrf2 family transcriptional regulator [Candidatus Latescibacteria bacterium]|nr:Rrf2 family transcriptional regulator [Candidatus Latescibacterota bacterium]